MTIGLIICMAMIILICTAFALLYEMIAKKIDKLGSQLATIDKNTNDIETKFGYVYGKLNSSMTGINTIKGNIDLLGSVVVRLTKLYEGWSDSKEAASINPGKEEREGSASAEESSPCAFPNFIGPDFLEMNLRGPGFFGYMLRCKKPAEESLDGDYVFIENGKECFIKMPDELTAREEKKSAWQKSSKKYETSCLGCIYEAKEEYFDEFIDTMTGSDEERKKKLLSKISSALTEFTVNGKYKPIYAVTHINQIKEDGRIRCPHIHILWGALKKITKYRDATGDY